MEPIGSEGTFLDMEQLPDDAADWERARAGDGEAFGIIFDRHRPRVLRHCVRLVATPSDAEDVLAVVFLEAWRKRDSVRFVDGSMLPWLLVTATNAAHNQARASRRYQRLLERLPAPALVADPAAYFGDDYAQLAMRTLSLKDQEVITVCVLQGLSEREAALVLGVPPGTVKSRLSRAKARLAERIVTPLTTEPHFAKEAPHAY